MSLLEVCSLIASFALAATRLLNAAKPFWSRWPLVATWLPPVVAALPALAASVGLVTTEVGLVEALLVAGALALPGLVPAPHVAAATKE
jgi:hypothetical protein